MRSKLRILQYLLFLAIGVWLSWLFFRDYDFNELFLTARAGNFSWFYVVMLVSVAVYILRVLRWQMLIEATGNKTSFANAFSALSLGYFVNFFFPRLGEVTRCLSVKKQDDIPFMQLLGTVIIERVVDIISLAVVLVLALLLQFNVILEFAKENVFLPIYEGIVLKIVHGNVTILIIAFATLLIAIFLFYHFRKYIREHSPKLIVKFVEGLKQGLASIIKLEKKGMFLFYTFLIWICYFLMTYFWFFVFNETSLLGWGACLSIVSIGTVGRSVPIQGGGMGAYHFLVMRVVMLYGVSETFGKTLATLIWSGQTFFTFAMGVVGLIIFLRMYWKRK